MPENYKRRPSLFQLREFARQIPHVEADRLKRLENAGRYYQNLRKTNLGGLPEEPDPTMDCYLNFPIFLNCNRERFVREMMKSGFDVATYYYRNCAELDTFMEYKRSLPNISRFVGNMIFCPVYPSIDPVYIDRLTKRTAELTSYLSMVRVANPSSEGYTKARR